jgi:glycosyltransferase involved in cell wall biosynthesis
MSSADAPVCLLVEQLRLSVPGGIGTYARGLVWGLHALGTTNVTLLASRPAGSLKGETDPIAALGYPVSYVGFPSQLFVRAADLGLLQAAPGRNGLPPGTRVVHSVSSLTMSPRGRAALSATVHDLAWRKAPRATTARGARWHEAALKRVARRADRIVVPSDETADDLLASGLGVGVDRIEVVAEGVEHLAPLDETSRADAAERLAALGVGGRPYLVSVGTLEPRKNLPRLLEAYGLLAGRKSDAPVLVVVGPAGWGPGLRPVDGVVFAGEVSPSELTGLYAGALALAYVPLAEGFGLPAAEAMSLGVPVVASAAVPSAKGAAIEVDPGDAHSIAAGLERALEGGAAREAVVVAGLARASGFSWRTAARAHLEIWDALAGG